MLTMRLPLSQGVADMPVIEGPFELALGDEVPVVAVCGRIEDPDSGHSVIMRIPFLNADIPGLIKLLQDSLAEQSH